MHEYYRIKESFLKMIIPLGFREDLENNDPDDFGSMYSEHSSGNHKLKLIWDGKDGVGYAQIYLNEQWEDIPSYIPESNESDFQQNLAALLNEIAKVIK